MSKESELRRRAEQQFCQGEKDAIPNAEAARRLLQVHQIELEMQNRELTEAQANLEESRNHYAAFYDFSPVGFITFDDQGHILDINLTAADMLDVERTRLVGKSFTPYAGDAPAFADHLRRCRDSSQRVSTELNLVVKGRREISVQMLSLKVNDHAAAETSVLRTVMLDISERKQAEENAELVTRRLDHILSSTPAVHYVCRIEGEQFIPTFISPNLVNMTDYGADDVFADVGWWASRIHPDDIKSVLADFPERLMESKILSHKYRFRHKNGQYLWVHDELRLICNDEGYPVEIVGSWIDITKFKALEDQLIQAQKMEAVGVLVGGIAHDFNNLLTSIVGNVDLARLEAENDQLMLGYLDAIDSSGMRAADMIKQLLTFARKGRLEMYTFSLRCFLQDTMKLAAAAIPENIAHSIEVPPEDLFIHGDLTQLQQILINLINNARDAVEGMKDGKIICSLKPYTADNAFRQRHPDCRGDSFGCLAVTDNGPGIPAEIMDRIFDPFFTTKEAGKGTGLGLSMVYGAVTSHKGAIEVDSAPGKTTFCICLPVVKPVAEQQQMPKQEIERGNNELILVADDEDPVLRIYEKILRTIGYRVIAARNGEEVVRLFEQHGNDISLAILDLIMPAMNGADAAEQIRRLHPHLPVIFGNQ